MIINFEEKSGGSKLSWHAYASRDPPPSHTLLDQNLDPRVYDPSLSSSQTETYKNFKNCVFGKMRNKKTRPSEYISDERPFLLKISWSVNTGVQPSVS